MSDDVRTLPRCQGKKASGEQCERVVGAGSVYCFAHDPKHAERRSRSASKASKSRLGAEISGIKREIREIMDGVKEGEISRSDAAVLFQGSGLLIKAVSESRKQAEFDEVRSEIAELREMFEANKSQGASWTG